MILWLYEATALLLLLAGVLLLWSSGGKSANNLGQRRFQEIFKTAGYAGKKTQNQSAFGRMGTGIGQLFLGGDKDEMMRLLRQAGWHASHKRMIFMLSSWLLPLLMVSSCSVYLGAVENMEGIKKVTWLFGAFLIGFLTPRYVLRHRASVRRTELAREMPTAVYLLRMLFEAGLTVEHALRVMQEEGRKLMPILSEEISLVIQRIEAGHDRVAALGEMAAPLDVPELTDTVAMLKQVTQQGGNIRDSLLKFVQLMESRQQAGMREYINSLSAKMSLVMMVFLFPALLIVLAAPGLMAIAKGLGGLDV